MTVVLGVTALLECLDLDAYAVDYLDGPSSTNTLFVIILVGLYQNLQGIVIIEVLPFVNQCVDLVCKLMQQCFQDCSLFV